MLNRYSAQGKPRVVMVSLVFMVFIGIHGILCIHGIPWYGILVIQGTPWHSWHPWFSLYFRCSWYPSSFVIMVCIGIHGIPWYSWHPWVSLYFRCSWYPNSFVCMVFLGIHGIPSIHGILSIHGLPGMVF